MIANFNCQIKYWKSNCLLKTLRVGRSPVMLATQIGLVGICIATSYSPNVGVYAALRLVTAIFQTTGYIAAFVYGEYKSSYLKILLKFIYGLIKKNMMLLYKVNLDS